MGSSAATRLAKMITEEGPRARRSLLLFLIAATPLVVVTAANNPINVPKITLLMMGVTVVGALRLAEITQTKTWPSVGRLWIPALAVAVPAVVSWLLNAHRGWTLFGEYGRLQGLLPTLVFVLFGLLIADTFSGDVRPVTVAVVIAATAAGALAILQALGVSPLDGYTATPEGAGAVGTFGNTNFTGGFLAIALPTAAALAWSDRTRALWACLVVIVGGLVASTSQGAWAAASAGLAVSGGLLLAPRSKIFKLLGVAAAALVGCALVLSIVLAPRFDLATGKLRLELWKAGISMGADRPLVGHGPNAFGYKSGLYRPASSATIREGKFYADDPHSVVVAGFANAGVLGVAGFLLLAGWVAARARRVEAGQIAAVGLVGALAAYLVQALVSIDEVSLRLLLWVALGALAAAGAVAPPRTSTASARQRGKRSRKTRVTLRMPAVVAVIGVGAAALLYWQVGFLVADTRARQARIHLSANPGFADAQMRQALGFRDEYEYRHTFGFALAVGALNLGDQGEDAIERALELFAFVPEFPDVPAILDKGRVLTAWAQFEPAAAEQAAELLLHAAELDPYNLEIRSTGATALRLDGRDQEAEQLLLSYLELVPAAEGWAELALLRHDLEDEEGAREALAEAMRLGPSEEAVLRAEQELSHPHPTPEDG